MRKKVLIFGATGSIGIYLTDYLLDHLESAEYELVAIGHRKTEYFSKKGIVYFPINLEDKSAFERLPRENIFAAVHLAGVLPARTESDDPYKYFDTNVLGSINLLEYLKSVQANRIIYTQTYADIAGHWEKEVTLYPDFPRKIIYTGDHALYTISKCAVEDLIEYYHQSFGLRKFIIRLPNIYMYAPEKYYYVNGERRLISYRYMIRRAIAGEPIELWGDPGRVRDMIYVKDLCQLIYKVLISGLSSGHYNAGTGVGTSIRDQIEGIIDVFCSPHRKSEILFCPEKRDAMQYIMDIKNAKEELGYNPKYMYRDYLLDYKKEMNSNKFQGL